jgi:hypothetical protein
MSRFREGQSATKETLNKAILALSARAAAKTRFSPCFEINDLPSSISVAHPCATGNARQIDVSLNRGPEVSICVEHRSHFAGRHDAYSSIRIHEGEPKKGAKPRRCCPGLLSFARRLGLSVSELSGHKGHPNRTP